MRASIGVTEMKVDIIIGSTGLTSASYQASAKGRGPSAMWKATATSWSSNKLQQTSRSGCESRRPSTGPMGIMAVETPAAASDASWAASHSGWRRVT